MTVTQVSKRMQKLGTEQLKRILTTEATGYARRGALGTALGRNSGKGEGGGG